MLQRPGAIPRARNSSASQALAPGARASNGLASDGMLAIRQRIRAPLKLAWPPSRIKKAATPDRSAATASRRVAVKSSAAGSPQTSPMTAERPAHLSPSSIAHSAERASRASTWMRLGKASPGGWIRPLSRIAIRSCTHSSGFAESSCATTNPAQPPSRGCAAKTSLRVGFLPSSGWWRGMSPPRMTPPPPFGRFPSPAIAGEELAGSEGARGPPPATREISAATRLESLCSTFVLIPASPG